MHTLDSFTVPDDTIAGLAYQVSIVYDDDLTSPEGDCYTETQRKAFANGDWHYVGVRVRPTIDGDPIDMSEASLWAVEYGHYPVTDEDDTVREWVWLDTDKIREYPLPDLIDECRADLAARLLPKAEALQRIAAELAAAS